MYGAIFSLLPIQGKGGLAMSGLLVLTEPIHRPFQTVDGRFQSCRHPFQLADGVVDLTGSRGVK